MNVLSIGVELLAQLRAILPDECEIEGCNRQGVRGNENIVSGMICCDYCHSRKLSGEKLKLRRA